MWVFLGMFGWHRGMTNSNRIWRKCPCPWPLACTHPSAPPGERRLRITGDNAVPLNLFACINILIYLSRWQVCDIFKSHIIVHKNKASESSPRKEECLCQVANWIWKIADLFSFGWLLLTLFLEESQRPAKCSFEFARYHLWMTKYII